MFQVSTEKKTVKLLRNKMFLWNTIAPEMANFLRNVTFMFKLDLDDMTLTSWVLLKATCIPNMSNVIWIVWKL